MFFTLYNYHLIDLFKTLINWNKKNYVNIRNKNETFQYVEESLLFDKVSIILFLNKEDLFEKKFRRSSLKGNLYLKLHQFNFNFSII